MTLIKNFRNLLALVLMVFIVAMWVIQGLGIISMPGEVVGASIAVWTLVAQFYFRKKGETDAQS